MGFQFQSIGSISPYLIERLAIDVALLGTLIGMYKLPGIALAYPAGLLGKRFGDKEMAVLGLALMTGGGALTAWAESYELALAGRTLSGIGAVFYNVLVAKMVADWFADRELTFAMAVLVNSWPFGIAMGLATQAPLAEAYSFQSALYATAAFCAVGLLLVVGLYDAPGGSSGAKQSGSKGGLAGLSAREFVLVSLGAMVWVLFNGCLILVVSFAPTFLTTSGLTPSEAGWLASIGTWLGILTVPLGGFLVQRWLKPDLFMSACFLVSGLLTIAIPSLDSWLLAFVAFGLIAWAPAGPIVALPVHVLRQENRAPGLGVFYSYYYVGIGLFAPIAGFLRDLTGDPGAPIVFAGALMLAALVFLLLLRVAERSWSRPLDRPR
jgi:predicted MFS family arabinose efflux permease